MTSGYMPEPVQMFRCPICGNLFESRGTCMDHCETCESERRRFMDSLVGRILFRSDDESLHIFIPQEVSESVKGDMVSFADACGRLSVRVDTEQMTIEELKGYVSVDADLAKSKTREWLDLSKDIIFDLFDDVRGGGLR